MTRLQHFSASFCASLLALSVAFSANATVSNVAVSGASNYDNVTTPTVPVIMGGYSGLMGDCTGGSDICNACSAMTTVCDSTGYKTACAESSIQPGAYLTVQFTIDQVPTGATTAAMVFPSGSSGVNYLLSATTPTLTAGGTISAQFQWGLICAKMGFNADCTSTTISSYVQTVTVGPSDATGTIASGAGQNFTLKYEYADPTFNDAYPVAIPANSVFGASSPFLAGCTSATNAPFCDFSLGNGDSKVYVNDLQRNSTGNSAGIAWDSARFYFAPITAGVAATTTSNGFCAVTIGSASNADLQVVDKTDIDGDGIVATDKITGLANDKPYVFLLATKDETSIVSYFMDQSQFLANADCAAGTVNGTCPYIGYPGQVVGLLDDQKCFIATAAFGSPMEQHVMLLRQFRNQFLLTNKIGKWFVHNYYRMSPPLAHWIAQHDTARAIARTMLWPFVWMADAMIDHAHTYFSVPLQRMPQKHVSAGPVRTCEAPAASAKAAQ